MLSFYVQVMVSIFTSCTHTVMGAHTYTSTQHETSIKNNYASYQEQVIFIQHGPCKFTESRTKGIYSKISTREI